MEANIFPVSDYMQLYRFLPVLDGDQIWKLRKIATGILSLNTFSEEEIYVLEARLLLLQKADESDRRSQVSDDYR